MKNIQMLCANPEAYNHCPIKYNSDLPEIITLLNRYFASSTKPRRKGERTILDTSILKLETDFEDVINNTLFELEQENFYYQGNTLYVSYRHPSLFFIPEQSART